MIHYTATTSDGQRLEYRPSPIYRAFRVVNRWFWLPRSIVRFAQRRAIQRRINGGPWQTALGVK